MVVVHHVRDRAADDPAHSLHDPFPTGVRVAPGQLHRGDVPASDLAILVDNGWRDMHAILAAGHFQVTGRTGMSQASAPEVDTDPDEAFFIAHKVDIVIAR